MCFSCAEGEAGVSGVLPVLPVLPVCAGAVLGMKDAAVSGDADAVRHTDPHHLHRAALRLPQPAACGGRHLRSEYACRT